MPKAYQVYQRVLQEGRAYLGRPKASDPETAQALLGLDHKSFAHFTHRLGLSSSKHLRYTVLPLACAEPPLGPILRELLAAGASFAELHKLQSRYHRRELELAQLQQAAQARAWRSLLARRRAQPDWARRPVWIFPTDMRLRRLEGLNPAIAEVLVERYSLPGEWVVDPMAGEGTVVQKALELGRRAWGSDLKGDNRLVKRLDIADLVEAVGQEVADLLVLHPPTFAWYVQHVFDPEHDEPPEFEYANWLSGHLGDALPVLKPGGRLVLIVRPEHKPRSLIRRDGLLRWTFVAPLENLLSEKNLEPLHYHLAVSEDGEEDWSIFVGLKRVQSD
ncbi:MAG: site-specific DNA-methyltransferase [Meiothermus sp.]|uniref:site-specific DNA-methyltransferase n=1 Tax=Meiothermus sp. TaxID=1955249 RepID=UPI0025D62108|nr:site-specific DNA-methyltransferase [Meiothermus sp.]MCS7067936.1 site-specific DNA-methyltransferase [Meiothermus sp.]MCX7601819.1 site-specific DNA-methyltransferase [Meiothermus sp.]